MKHKNIILSIIFLVLLLMNGGVIFASGSQESEMLSLKMNTIGVPLDNHTVTMKNFKDDVNSQLEGKVNIQLYDSGSLFGQEEEFPALLKGDIDIAYVSANTFSDYIPSMTMFTAGYIFKDYDHMRRVYGGDIGKEVFKTIEDELDLVVLAVIYLGARQINLRDIGKVVEKPEDLKGVKLRMPNSAAWMFLGQALGANPTPLNFSELYLALKTGTVDGQDNPLPTDKNAKFYEVTHSISLTNHVINAEFLMMNKNTWSKLTNEQQTIIKNSALQAQEAHDAKTLNDEKELVQFMKDQGLVIVKPDIDAFTTHVQSEYLKNEEMTKTWDMDLYKKIQALGK